MYPEERNTNFNIEIKSYLLEKIFDLKIICGYHDSQINYQKPATDWKEGHYAENYYRHP